MVTLATMKMLILISYLFLSLESFASEAIPNVKIEYSYALDMFCPQKVDPEVLTPEQAALIEKIPIYRVELLSKLAWLQNQWDSQGQPLLKATVKNIGKPFTIQDLQAAVFLCPRFPFMGTPLSLNVMSYLESSARDIPGLGKPMSIFFFVSTTFHEILHKYINAILEKQPSAILRQTSDSDLYKAHLHLFALQKLVFESLGLSHLLSQIGQLEALHGADYARAWKAVHSDSSFYNDLIEELKK